MGVCSVPAVLCVNAAARLSTNTLKFDHGLVYMRRHILHWLDVSDQIKFHLHVSLSTSVYMEWHLVICHSCADQFLNYMDDITCILLVVTFLMSDVLLMENGHLPMLAHLLGTHYLMI